MVVRLIFEHEEPLLILAVYVHRNADAARIDLLGFIEVLQFALRAQRFHSDDGNVHERHIALIIFVNCLAVIAIALIGLRDRRCKESTFDIH